MDVMSQIRNLALGLSVAALLPMAVYWGVGIIMPAPMYPHYPQIGDLPAQERKVKKEEHEKKVQEYRELRVKFDRFYFYTAAPIGLVALIAGALSKVPFLGVGLVLGGTACLTHGYWTYWDTLDALAKFISLLLALLLIIALGYRIAAREQRR